MDKLEQWAVEVIEKAVKHGAEQERKRIVEMLRKWAKDSVLPSSQRLRHAADRIEQEDE